MKRLVLLSLALLLSGCASGQGKPNLPFDAWFVGLGAPSYMEVWIESVDVIDRRGLAYEQVYQGISAVQTPPQQSGQACRVAKAGGRW